MNKYSKRALKTTATVGMSLAMVLSAVAVPTNVKAAETVCSTDQKAQQIMLTRFFNDVIKLDDVKTADSTKKVSVETVVKTAIADDAVFTEYYKLPSAKTVVADSAVPTATEITLAEAQTLELALGTKIALENGTGAIDANNPIVVGDSISYKATAAVTAGDALGIKDKVNLFEYLGATTAGLTTEKGMGTNATAFKGALTDLKTKCVGEAYDQANYLVDMKASVTLLNGLVSTYNSTYSVSAIKSKYFSS